MANMRIPLNKREVSERPSVDTKLNTNTFRAMFERMEREERLELVEQMLVNGTSLRAIARTLGIDPKTVRGYRDEILGHVQAEHLPSLQDRINESVLLRLDLYRDAKKMINSNAVDAARAAAIKTASDILDSVDKLRGTQAPDSLNSAALAEFYDVTMSVLGEVDPQLQQAVLERLQARLSGSSAGVVLAVAPPPATRDAQETEETEADHTQPGDDVVESAAETVPAVQQRKAAYFAMAKPIEREEEADDIDWPELPPEPEPEPAAR